MNDPSTLSIDAQVAWFIVGANYGNEQIQKITARATHVRGDDNLLTE